MPSGLRRGGTVGASDPRSPASSTSRRAVVRPLTDADIPRAAAFLHERLNNQVSAAEWERALLPSWGVDAPNHGYLLVVDERVVGVYVAFYSQRDLGDRTVNICNLGAWCVEQDHRFQGVRLLRSLLAQPGYVFTDLSPSGNVIALNSRLGFTHLDTRTALILNLPLPTWRARVVSKRDQISGLLHGRDLRIYLDHADDPAARHVVLTQDNRACYVMYRKDRRKGLPLFVSLLHVSDPDLLQHCFGVLRRHLLVRHGAPFTLAELRLVGTAPRGAKVLARHRAKMYRGDLAPGEVDSLYSELTRVAW